MKVSDLKVGEKYTSNALKSGVKEYITIKSYSVFKDKVVVSFDYYKISDNSFVNTRTSTYDLDDILENFYPYKEPVKFPYEFDKKYTCSSREYVIIHKVVNNMVHYTYKVPSDEDSITSSCSVESFLRGYNDLKPYEEIVTRRTWETISELNRKHGNYIHELVCTYQEELSKKDKTIEELQKSYKELNDRKNSYQQAEENLRKNYNSLVEENKRLEANLLYWKIKATGGTGAW